MKFYNHPIINAIILDPCISKSELIKQLKIAIRTSLRSQLRHLESELHLQYNFGTYRPASLSLWVKKKNSDVYIDKVHIGYIPPRELHTLLNYNHIPFEGEDGFGFCLFIDKIPILKDHKDFIARLSPLQLDFDQYDYFLRGEFVDLTKGAEKALKPLTIVQLDDHPVMSGCIKDALIVKYLPGSDWNYFMHPDEALSFLDEKFDKGEKVHLILTDINHLGLNGYEFGKAVKELELKHNNFHIPIVVISFTSEDHPLVSAGLEEGIFNRHFSKGEDMRVIGNYLKSQFFEFNNTPIS